MPEVDVSSAPTADNAGDVLPIRGEGLVFERGGRRILDDIDIEIGGTGTLVLIGPNGAGKSLLVRVLAGLVAPTAGRGDLGGRRSRPAPRAAGSASCFSGPCCCAARRWPTSSMRWRSPAWRARIAAGAPTPPCERARLTHLAHAPARVLSGGEQQLLSIARALGNGAGDPDPRRAHVQPGPVGDHWRSRD